MRRPSDTIVSNIPMPKQSNAPKADRLTIRLSPDERSRLDAAAEAVGTTRNRFVLDSALDAAERVLEDNTTFLLQEPQWTKFQQCLDAPELRLERIEALVREPSPFRAR